MWNKIIFHTFSLMSMSLFPILNIRLICQHLFCSKVRNAVEELALLGSSNSQHKELDSALAERDNNGFLKILIWFCNHDPSTASEKLVCLDSGYMDENNIVNCDRAENIGVCIQKLLHNEIFT